MRARRTGAPVRLADGVSALVRRARIPRCRTPLRRGERAAVCQSHGHVMLQSSIHELVISETASVPRPCCGVRRHLFGGRCGVCMTTCLRRSTSETVLMGRRRSQEAACRTPPPGYAALRGQCWLPRRRLVPWPGTRVTELRPSLEARWMAQLQPAGHCSLAPTATRRVARMRHVALLGTVMLLLVAGPHNAAAQPADGGGDGAARAEQLEAPTGEQPRVARSRSGPLPARR